MTKVTIMYSVLMELLKQAMAKAIIDECLKEGEIDIIDDVSGEKIGKIHLKKKGVING